MYDVIVVGAGHNGLTCGAFLARAGRRVLVVESREIVGGYCTTEEMVKEAPGFKMNPCAVDTALTEAPISVVEELNLAKYGLRFVYPDPWAAYINKDGASIGMWKDRERTRQEIARFSAKDAAAFEKFCALMTDAWYALLPYYQDHPTRPSLKTMGQMLYRAAKGRKSLRYAANVFMGSPEGVIEEHFERPETKAVLANLGAWSMLPLQEPGSGGVLAMMCSYFRWGVARPIGGSGEFTKALAACIVDHGGEVRTSAPVEEIIVRGERTAGVRLASGEEIPSRHVIGAIDPQKLLGDLVDQAHVPDDVRGQLRAMGNLRWNISCLKSDVALSESPSLACGREEIKKGYLLLGPTIEYVKEAQAASMVGELPEQMPMGPMFPSLVDRSQVPEGSDGETVYLYMQAVPRELSGGRSWDDEKDAYIKKVIHELDDYAPGLEKSVIGQWCQSPLDLERKSATRGNIVHADMSIHQMGPFRPIRAMAGYKTPIGNLWHTAAGAHPMGALNGWSGRTTGKMVDRILRKQGATTEPVSVSTYQAPPAPTASTNGARQEEPVKG